MTGLIRVPLVTCSRDRSFFIVPADRNTCGQIIEVLHERHRINIASGIEADRIAERRYLRVATLGSNAYFVLRSSYQAAQQNGVVQCFDFRPLFVCSFLILNEPCGFSTTCRPANLSRVNRDRCIQNCQSTYLQATRDLLNYDIVDMYITRSLNGSSGSKFNRNELTFTCIRVERNNECLVSLRCRRQGSNCYKGRGIACIRHHTDGEVCIIRTVLTSVQFDTQCANLAFHLRQNSILILRIIVRIRAVCRIETQRVIRSVGITCRSIYRRIDRIIGVRGYIRTGVDIAPAERQYMTTRCTGDTVKALFKRKI